MIRNSLKTVWVAMLVLMGLGNAALAQTVAAGTSHSVWLCSDGSAYAAGAGGSGALGNGTTFNDSIPIKVNTVTGIKAIYASEGQSFFVKSDSTVWAVGWNNKGQLGDGTTVNKLSPVMLSSLSGIVAVAAGYWHTLFLKSDGTVWACGDNAYGQLGDGTVVGKTTPVQVAGLSGITAIAAGGSHHSLFLKSDGTVWATGRNNSGQLGDATMIDKNTPTVIPSLSGIIGIAAGTFSYSLFLKSDSTVMACGLNDYGQLGDGTTVDKATPVAVGTVSGIKAMAGGGGQTLFLKSDNTVWAVGRNDDGQLGDGTNVDKLSPVMLSTISNVTSFSTGTYHTLFRKTDGTAWGCGNNYRGKLGDSNSTYHNSPIEITRLCKSTTSIKEVAMEQSFSVFPNPFSNSTTIQSAKMMKDASFAIYNCMGQKVKQLSQVNGQSVTISRDNLPSGIYFVEQTEANDVKMVGKIIVADN